MDHVKFAKNLRFFRQTGNQQQFDLGPVAKPNYRWNLQVFVGEQSCFESEQRMSC